MKKIENIKEIQKITYRMLKFFSEFCEENNLKYCLGGGSALGAIRHNGFIPWDDDIDIIMPRPDYMRFISLIREKKGNNIFEKNNIVINSIYLGSKTIFPFIRITDSRTKVIQKRHKIHEETGIWIDIQPSDGVPKNKYNQKLYYYGYRILADCYLASITKLGVKRRNKLITYLQWGLFPIYWLFSLLDYEKMLFILDKYVQKYDFEKSSEVMVFSGRAGLKEIFNKEQFFSLKKLKFEDKEYNVPGNIDLYLKRLYGDYMEIPPIEKREKHEMEAYWIEEKK